MFNRSDPSRSPQVASSLPKCRHLFCEAIGKFGDKPYCRGRDPQLMLVNIVKWFDWNTNGIDHREAP